MNACRWAILAGIFAGAAGAFAACGTSEEAALGPGPTSSGAVGGGGSGAASSGQAGEEAFDSGGGCTSNAQCDGGVCLQGKCCPMADKVCGEKCCAEAQVCLFEQCLEPGAACFSAADCAEGEYCEPALGEKPEADGGADDGGADAGDSDGGKCTQALPPSGRCVPLPPVCGEGEEPDAGSCIPKCEYHPPAGKLNAVRKWQWGYDPPPVEYPNHADVWATPTVARIYDANCDGKVDMTDPANVIFVSGNAKNTCCSCSGDPVSTCLTGVLRLLDGKSGKEIWSLAKPPPPGQHGFAGMSVAVGDVDGDKRLDILAMTGNGYIAMVDAEGNVKRMSDKAVAGVGAGAFGWGAGLAVADMDGDGFVEIAFGRTLYTTTNDAITWLWYGSGGWGGYGGNEALSHFADLDLDGQLELVAGSTAYRKDGTMLWNNGNADGFTAVADFDGNGTPELVVIFNGTARLLEGATGKLLLGPLTLPGSQSGGPPTVADFDGDGKPEIGVAQANLYSMIKPNFADKKIDVVWTQKNHDFSSSVTGSSVFDFEGDGKAEVIYNDECYLWVYDGQFGDVLFVSFTQSFTATEANALADVDGDGHADILLIANGASPNNWTCAHHDAPGKVIHGHEYPVWEKPQGGPHYRGITAFQDSANSWVGTRTLWNEHTYHVTNICDPRDSACAPGAYYGQIPAKEKKNWEQPWLNNFRQNVQDKGIFDAPDATVKLGADCVSPVPLHVQVRNIGLAALPAAVEVGLYKVTNGEELLGTVQTTEPLLAGQTELIEFAVPADKASPDDTFLARILIDPDAPKFHECREDNNESQKVKPGCVH
ncbi:MAG: VCBS repeat-containing protein [Deltaproteobacteria bacterium]|nr:VCBS repeat-containing protein [Deltaproteobacteria bacterium]